MGTWNDHYLGNESWNEHYTGEKTVNTLNNTIANSFIAQANGFAIIAVALSGNPKLYHYKAAPADVVNVGKGDRVVIPNKAKDDGSLSLSIGTVDHVLNNGGQIEEVILLAGGLDKVKPIVQVLDNNRLREVQLAVLKMEAANVG